MNETPLVILDIETTGLSPYRHGITEIAAVKVVGGEIVDRFHTMVNPAQPIPRFITRLTGIDDSMVADAPSIRQVLPTLHNFMKDAIFVGHNVGFDHKFIDHFSRMYFGRGVENEVLCTCKLARRLLPDLPSKKLTALCEYFQIENTQAHRAMNDVLATTALMQHLQVQTPQPLSVNHLLSLQKIARKQVPQFLGKISQSQVITVNQQ